MSSITDELSRYIQKYELRTNCKPGAIPVTEKEVAELRKILLENYRKEIQAEDNIEIDLMVMEFAGIDLYEHVNAEQIRNQ